MNKIETLKKICYANRIQSWRKKDIIKDKEFYHRIVHLKTLSYNPKEDDLKKQVNYEFDYIIWNTKYLNTLLGKVLNSE